MRCRLAMLFVVLLLVLCAVADARLFHGLPVPIGGGGGGGGGGGNSITVSCPGSGSTGSTIACTGTYAGTAPATTGWTYSWNTTCTGTGAPTVSGVGGGTITSITVATPASGCAGTLTFVDDLGSTTPSGSVTITGGGGNTVADAAHSTSAEVGQYLQFTLAWGGSAPTALTSATWSGGGGAATVAAFSQTGPLVQFWASVPTSAGTYNLAIIANNGATVTVSGIAIAAPGNDAAAFPTAGIYGPSTATIGEGSGGDNGQFQNNPIAQYFARGFVGPPVISFTSTAGHTGAGNSVCTKALDGVTFGDQYCFETQPNWSPEGAGEIAGFVLCASQQMVSNAYQAAFYIDVTLTDSATGAAYTKHVVIDHPHDPYVYFYGARTIIPQSGNNTQIGAFGFMLDSMLADESGGNVVVGLLNGHAASLTFTDASGLFTYSNGTSLGGEVLILKSKLISANFGDHTFTVAAAGGATVTYHVYIAHEYQPQIGYFPNGTLYSSNPVTNGFGSWPIATVRAYNDAHGAAHEWHATHFTMLSDSSGALNLWDTGKLYLTSPISAGTINASFSATGLYGQSTTMVLALPVTLGTTLTGALTGTITPSLENYVGYSNFLQAGNCPACAPISVIALTASGITPVWGSTTIDVLNMGGTMVSNVQFADGGYAGNQDTNLFAARHNPRYVLSGASGSTATVKANDLSAINHDTPQVDPVVITVTDGNGTFDTETFNLSVAWVQRATTEITVGPSNANYSSPTYPDMYHAMQAMWADYNANGQASTMAGVSVRLLRGVVAEAATPSSLGGTTGWDFCPGGGGSGYTCGRYPFPVQIKGDDSQQASFVGTLSGTNLTVTGSNLGKPGIYPGDYIDSGVGSLKVMVISQTSGTTHYNGVYVVHIGPTVAGTTASVSATPMTTKMPRTFLNFAGRTVPGGSQQGCIMLNGGYDVDVKGLEITGCQNSYSGTTYEPGGQSRTVAAIWTSDGARGNLSLRDSYIYDSGNGILNSGFGAHFLIDRSMFWKNGDNSGGAHNIYASSSASFTMTNSVSCDTLTVHDVKTRAAYNRINHNVICDGINGAGSNPLEITVGGDTIVDSNLILKPANTRAEFNGNIIQISPELQVVGQDGFPMNWPVMNIRVTNNSILASTPLANNIYPSARGVVAFGWTKTYGSPTFVDEVRNRPVLTSASGNKFWHMPDGTTGGLGTTEWRGTENGGIVTNGGGNTTLTTYPASALEIVDLITGTPPFHLPPPGACGCVGPSGDPWRTGSVASATGVYGVTMVVPDGSPDGTLVGHLAARGPDWAEMTGPPTYSLVALSTSNNNSMFRLVPSGNGVDVVTNGTISAASCLAPGVCSIEIQGVGAGFNYGGFFSSPYTASQVLAVVVGNYD